MNKDYDIAIIGGGAAGLTAAIYSTRAGNNTVIIEKAFPGGQVAISSKIENYPGIIGADGSDIAIAMFNQAQQCGAQIEYSDIAKVELKDIAKIIHLNSGNTITAKAVIIATGASPRKIGVDGEDRLLGRGISYCATCDGALYKGKTVAIVGGGNTAVEEARYLAKFAKQVYIIHRRDTFRATKAEIQGLDTVGNITKVMDSQVIALVGDNKLDSIVVKNKVDNSEHSIVVEGLFVAIGRQPETQLFQGQLDMDDNGYIIAGENTKTNLDRVYVAGDVRTKTLRQIVTATADGAIAATEASLAINNN